MTYYLRLLSLALAIIWPALSFSFEMKASIKVARPTSIELYDLYQATGECKASTSRDFYATTSGIITNVTDKQGALIKAGDVIIEIDGGVANALQKKELAAFNSAEFTLKKDRALFEKKLISEEALKKSEAAFRSAKHNLEAAEKEHGDMVIIAPFDGKVGVIKHRVGDHVSASEYLVSITSGESQEIIAHLPEKLMGAVKYGGKVEVMVGKDELVRGEIAAISPHISKESGAFAVKVAASEPELLKHGSFARVKFYLNSHNGLAIDEKAVMRNEKGSFVFILDNDSAKEVHVTLGTRLGDKVEVISGLTKDDKVVVEGLSSITNGAKVKVIEGDEGM